MKLCILTAFYPPFVLGGAEICAELFAKISAEAGIETFVVTPNYSSFEKSINKNRHLVVHRFKSLRFFLFKKRKVSEKIYEKNRPLFYLINNQYMKFSAWELAKEFQKLHKKEKFDLLICNNIEANLALAKINAPVCKVAHILDPANFCFNLKTQNNGVFCDFCNAERIASCLRTNKPLSYLLLNDVINRRVTSLRKSDYFISMNQYLKELLVMGGFDPKKIVVIHNPIGKEPFSELGKEASKRKLGLDFKNIVLFLSSLTYKKGAHIVYELAEKMPDYNFVIVGFGPLENRFKNSRLKNIHFMGHIPFTEIKYYYKAADIFIFPNTMHEGMCRNIVEAQINGTPVIASDIKGISEGIVHNETGILVKLGDTDSFKKAIQALMSNKKLRKKISSNAKEYVKEEYNPDLIKKKYLASLNYFIDKYQLRFKQ